MTMTMQTSEPRAPVLPRDVAMRLAAAEYERFADMLRALRPGDWTRPTECPGWDVRAMAETFFDFALADLARYQLMNQRTIPGFRPSEEAYAASIAVYERMRVRLAECGVRAQADLDLCTAIIGGFVDQQLANDPGGSRWRGQLPRLMDMYCDEVGVPGPRLRGTP